MPTPTWQAPTSGSVALAAHGSQLLGTHGFQSLYTATQRAAVVTNGATVTTTASTFLAESFTTAVGQTTIGYVTVPVTASTSTGTTTSTTTLGVFANSAGAPTGSAISSTTLTAEYAWNAAGSGSQNVLVTYPLPTTGLSASTQYWLVLGSTSSTGNYSWFRSAAASGASTSPDGTTWTAQAYGFRYAVFDQTVSGPLVSTWEDSGARWTVTTYRTNGEINTFAEYTAGQTASGYLQGFRTLSYTTNALTGVA
jgi:hypothetical protein